MAGLVAVVALALAYRGAVHAYGAISAATGLSAYEVAVSRPEGLDRQEALHRAQAALTTAVQISPMNAEAWMALAETRSLQAVAGGTVSPELARAAAVAAENAAALDPRNAAAFARWAEALAMAGAEAAAIAEPLAESYALDAQDLHLSAFRPNVAFQAWASLPPVARDDALTEACFFSRETPERFAALRETAVQAADPDLAERLAGLLTDAACQPAPGQFVAQTPPG